MPLLGGDAEVVSDADGKGDIVFTQELHPVGAYEFTVGQKKADSLRRKICEIAVTSRQVVWLFFKQLWFEFVPVFHGLHGRFTAQG